MKKKQLFLTALFKVKSGADYGEFISILLKNYFLIVHLLQIEKYICIFNISIPPKLSREQNELCKHELTEIEVRVALNKMENNKASGNKGLSQNSPLKPSADTIFQKGFLTEEYFSKVRCH